MNVKNENGTPIANATPVMTTGSHSSSTNDIIDLTEIDDCKETSDVSVIDSNNSVLPQQPSKPARSRGRTSTNSSENGSPNRRRESLDDSICILFEKIQPPPEIVFVNEVIVDGREQNRSDDVVIDGRRQNQSADAIVNGREQNQSAGINSSVVQVPPIILGSYNEEPIHCQERPEQTSSLATDFPHIPPLFPEILSEGYISSFQPINYNFNYEVATSQPTSRPSCKYALRSCNGPQQVELPRLPLVTNQESMNLLDLKTVPYNAPSHHSELKNSNVMAKVPKIQCGICLDGPDEIAASDRNFTSTNCGHVFCNTCIKISMKNAAKCPKCRKKITAKSIHPLFL